MWHFLHVLVALPSRILFFIHGIVTVWRVVVVKDDPCFWLLLIGVALLGVEMAITIKYTCKVEWKWFSPTVFLYLSTMIPSIWFLELNLLQPNLSINNSSSDFTLLPNISKVVGLTKLEPENWVVGLEQTMLIVLVLGRWLMPKGDMSRDELSQLLMVYLGLGADILEIFDAFREPELKNNQAVIIVGLSLFSWALMQFPFVPTQKNNSKADEELQPKPVFELLSCSTTCCSSEIWSLLLTVGLQDGPFLVYRLYLMLRMNVLNQLMIFFTCKNILIVMLELYRIYVVHFEQAKPGTGKRSAKIPKKQLERQNGDLDV